MRLELQGTSHVTVVRVLPSFNSYSLRTCKQIRSLGIILLPSHLHCWLSPRPNQDIEIWRTRPAQADTTSTRSELPSHEPRSHFLAMSSPHYNDNGRQQDLSESQMTIPSDSENYDANNEMSESPRSSSSSPMILYSPPTVWGLLRGAAINVLLPFINGLMLGFGELFANELAFRFGWSGTKVRNWRRRFCPGRCLKLSGCCSFVIRWDYAYLPMLQAY